MRLIRILFLLFISQLCFGQGFAQEYYFEPIGTIEGETNISVRKIIQDNEGFIWLATFNGLYRYEGDEYIIKHNFLNNREVNSDITCLLLDKKNNIWIGTDQGLLKYNHGTEILTTYFNDKKDNNSISSNRIRSLALGEDGKIWIGTRETGLNVYIPEDSVFVRINFENFTSNPPTHVKSILIDGENKVWAGTLYNGLYCISLSGTIIDSVYNFRSEGSINYLNSNAIYSIYKNMDGNIIVGTQNGLHIYNPEENNCKNISSEIFTPGSLSDHFKTIFRDNNNQVWMGTQEGLIVCSSFREFAKGKYQIIRHTQNPLNSLSHNQILDIFQDRSGIIWIGTESGLNKFDTYRNQFQPLQGSAINQLKEVSATSFLSYGKGMFVLTLSDGLLYKQGDEVRFFSPTLYKDTEIQSEKFHSIFVDQEKDIWLGSNNGFVIKLDNNGQIQTKIKIQKENAPVYSIKKLDNINLLIGTGSLQGNLYIMNIKTGEISTMQGLSNNNHINHIHIDQDKNIWLATHQGIFCKETNDTFFIQYLPDNPDSVVTPNIFNDIEESDKGEVYFAGRNGMYRYDKGIQDIKKIEFRNEKNTWATNLEFDSKQNLWINLNFNRIAKWNMKSDHLMIFHVNNGVRNTPNNHRGFYIDKNDVLYFSGFDQIFRVNIANIDINTFSPSPVFSKLVINNTEIRVGENYNKQLILTKNIYYNNKLTLNHQNRDFTISFFSASYSDSRNNKYRYILHGHDKKWTVGNERYAHYADLKPGRYVFEVFGSNNYGFWSDEPAVLNISIKPSPFLSIWAILMYVTILTTGTIQTRKIILARIKLKRELLIEKVKREKEDMFHKERLRFYTNISHELRTPLTLIMGPIKQLISLERNNDFYIKLFQLIHNNSQRLLSLVNQLLDFRKSLFEGIKIKATYSNITEIILANVNAFDYMAREKSISLHFNEFENDVNGWVDLEKFDIMLFNVLSNAFKYTPSGGFVTIDLTTCKPNNEFITEFVEIKVANSGKGIPKHLQDKVFERFYKAENDDNFLHQNTSTGIGLSFVKNLVDLHHGKITVESEPEKTTLFTISLPLGKEAYNDDEIFDFKRDVDRRTKELIQQSVKTENKEEISNLKDAPKLLIIEDNTEIRNYLVEYLEKDYLVFDADDGQKGLELCLFQLPHIVITDIMMVNMDGLEFCKRLKSTPEISHIPVILMTALASVENKKTGYKLGADDYITKPFEPELLRIRIQNLLNRISEKRLRFADSLDISVKELTISKIDEDFIEKVTVVLDRNIQKETVDIAFISKELGVSTSHLYRKIKHLTDLSPIEFVNTYRLKKAAHLLKRTGLNVSEIAFEVGFSNPNYFSRIFKKQFNVSPSEFKK